MRRYHADLEEKHELREGTMRDEGTDYSELEVVITA